MGEGVPDFVVYLFDDLLDFVFLHAFVFLVELFDLVEAVIVLLDQFFKFPFQIFYALHISYVGITNFLFVDTFFRFSSSRRFTSDVILLLVSHDFVHLGNIFLDEVLYDFDSLDNHLFKDA